METKIIIIGIFAIIAAGVLALGLLKAIFKKSIVFSIGVIFLVVIDFIACLAFFVGSTGIIHMSWGIPAAIISLFIAYYLIAQKVQKPIQLVTRNINKISEGDLDITFDNNVLSRSDELGEITNSIDHLKRQLTSVINEIYATSERLTVASQELNTSAEQLSQGAAEQAASSEEVLSSIEEMSSSISQNAQNAIETERIAKLSAEGIRDGHVSANKAVASIKEISDEISIISDISHQTNILALNAAVEAARAGEHGKGFAVVAAEVRKLAEKSKVAADKIENISKIGVDTVVSAGNILEKLVPEIEKTASLVQEITSAGVEQETGTAQINKATQQLNVVTQQYASTSQEVASSSKSLSDLALNLLDLIKFFKIDNIIHLAQKEKPSKKENIVTTKQQDEYVEY